jgi:hypothetical protein
MPKGQQLVPGFFPPFFSNTLKRDKKTATEERTEPGDVEGAVGELGRTVHDIVDALVSDARK